MNVEFDKSFLKSIDKVRNQNIKERTIRFIEQLEKVEKLTDLSEIKKLKGDSISYRKKIGDYRVGFEFQNNITRLIIIAHRKDIYRYFP